MRFLRSGWLSFLYYLSALALAGALIASAAAVVDGERAVSSMDSAEEKTDSLVKSWMERFSFGFYTGASEKQQAREQIEAMTVSNRLRVNRLALALAGCSAAYLFAVWYARHHLPARDRPRLLIHLHGVAGVCLVVGLLAPMLTIVAQREVAMLGRVVLHFESKSILATVGALADNGNLFVAVLLAAFSVVVPVFKLLLSLAALLLPPGAFRDRCLHVVKLVGKWSMTDVFVVAVLLAFLSLGDGGLTDARLGPGLYFFAAYGLLSFCGGMALAHARAGRMDGA